MEGLHLSSLFSDGMVLQRNAHVRIWGYDSSSREVNVILTRKINHYEKEIRIEQDHPLDEDKQLIEMILHESKTLVNHNGYWETWIDTKNETVDCELLIKNLKGEECRIKNVCIGDVFICAGQSNMELPMNRVKDQYPEEIENPNMPYVRQFKIPELCDFHKPVTELLGGSWEEAQTDTIRDFSATAYFFGKSLYENSKVPIGLINASYGGSRIQSWMSRDMLADFKEELEIADRYSDDSFIIHQLDKNDKQMMEWHGDVDKRDLGLAKRWYENDCSVDEWDTIDLPGFFINTPLEEFIGVVWFKKDVLIPRSMVGKKANLWLGTIVDSDEVYVNEFYIGKTEYQYPPRKYSIPEGVLQEGVNKITIRVKCENGNGRFTPDKEYCIFTGEHHKIEECIDLTGTWSYRIGAKAKKIPPTDFVNWKPTGLYNGMMAPCHRYTISGMIWYQGEGNTYSPFDYEALSLAMINGYRANWNQGNFPYYYVQLPNFSIDLEETYSGWPELREEQERLQQFENTGMVCAIDLGEDNDLHPLKKKEVGERLARLVRAKQYKENIEYSGPTIEGIEVVINEQEMNIVIECGHVSRLLVKDRISGSHKKEEDIIDFQVAGDDRVYKTVAVRIDENKIYLQLGKEEQPRYLRYCHSNAPKGALLYNEDRLPMAPFTRYLL